MIDQDRSAIRSSSRSDNRRIVVRCNCCRDLEDGRKDKQAGLSFDRNRLTTTPAEMAGIPNVMNRCHGWQKQWGFESLDRTTMPL